MLPCNPWLTDSTMRLSSARHTCVFPATGVVQGSRLHVPINSLPGLREAFLKFVALFLLGFILRKSTKTSLDHHHYKEVWNIILLIRICFMTLAPFPYTMKRTSALFTLNFKALLAHPMSGLEHSIKALHNFILIKVFPLKRPLLILLLILTPLGPPSHKLGLSEAFSKNLSAKGSEVIAIRDLCNLTILMSKTHSKIIFAA